MALDFNKMGGAAKDAGFIVAGTVLAGFARKKVTFLDTTLGKVILVFVALMIISSSKSDILKGLGMGIAANGALGLAGTLGLAGMDGLNGIESDGMGSVVQDENGMVYVMNGVGEFEPYEVPQVQGIAGNYDETFAGVNGAKDELYYAA